MQLRVNTCSGQDGHVCTSSKSNRRKYSGDEHEAQNPFGVSLMKVRGHLRYATVQMELEHGECDLT
jgi:hypothetical protein